MSPQWFHICQQQLCCAQSRISVEDVKGNIWGWLETLLFIDSWKYHCFLHSPGHLPRGWVCLTGWRGLGVLKVKKRRRVFPGHSWDDFTPLPVWWLWSYWEVKRLRDDCTKQKCIETSWSLTWYKVNCTKKNHEFCGFCGFLTWINNFPCPLGGVTRPHVCVKKVQ